MIKKWQDFQKNKVIEYKMCGIISLTNFNAQFFIH